MNYARILRVTNWFLVLIGYQMHSYEPKTRRYRLSIWFVVNFSVLASFYLIAFTHHFERSDLLELMQSVSPFLKRLIRLQVLLGIKIFLYGFYEFGVVTRAANEISSILPEIYAKKFTKKEAFAYFLNFSTLFIAFGICLYVAIEMEFELPPLDHILVFCGLMIPHFILSGSLRMFNISTWLLREQILDLNQEFESLVAPKAPINGPKEVGIETLECGEKTKEASNDLSDSMQLLSQKLNNLAKAENVLNTALQRQLILFVLLNSNCLLAGTYSRVYYETYWHVIFMQRTKNIFQATNCGIFILIFWDYLTLGLMQSIYGKVKSNFERNLQIASKQREHFTETARFILADLQDTLRNNFHFKLPGSLKVNLWTFLALHVFVALTIALIVVYQYLNDQIIALNEQFDGFNDVDD